MVRTTLIFMAVLGLAACEDGGGFNVISGEPFGEDDGAADGSVPPDQVDSSSPLADGGDFCSSEGGSCSGDVILVRFDTETPESILIRGLPFDDDVLDAVYNDDGIAILGPGRFRDFAPDGLTNDTGTPISDQYIAVFARNNNVSAGAVKAAEYGDFGYGGAFYSVNTAVDEVPVSETLAVYRGDYAGLRAFVGQSGLNVVQGELFLQLDNNSTTAEPVVKGAIVRDTAGLIGAPADDVLGGSSLQTIILSDAPLVDGTYAGAASIRFDADDDGAAEEVMTGTYQGTFGGANAGSTAGIVQMTGNLTTELPDLTGIAVEETGAFIGNRED